MEDLTDSILTSVKKMLGIHESDESFDADIIMCINSVFSILTQLGVGPSEGFQIFDADRTWDKFLSEEEFPRYAFIKSYVAARVRLMFDPPQSTAMVEVLNRQVAEFEWRLKTEVELDEYGKEESTDESEQSNVRGRSPFGPDE